MCPEYMLLRFNAIYYLPILTLSLPFGRTFFSSFFLLFSYAKNQMTKRIIRKKGYLIVVIVTYGRCFFMHLLFSDFILPHSLSIVGMMDFYSDCWTKFRTTESIL